MLAFSSEHLWAKVQPHRAASMLFKSHSVSSGQVSTWDTAPVQEVWKAFPVTYASVDMSEDCLHLNVYRPTGTASGDKLPVGTRAHVHNDSAKWATVEKYDRADQL